MIPSPYLENPDAEPIRKREANVRRVRRTMVATVVALIVLTVVMSLTLVSWLADDRSSDAAAAGSPTDTLGKPVAVESLLRWLATEPQPIPGGTMLSWDSVEVTPRPEVPEGSSDAEANTYPKYDLETHSFTVIDASGSLYEATVTVRSNPELGAVVIGTPTAVRVPPSVDEGGDWETPTPGWGTSPCRPRPRLKRRPQLGLRRSPPATRGRCVE